MKPTPRIPVPDTSWRCGKCGYDLTGLEAQPCPECGLITDPRSAGAYSRRVEWVLLLARAACVWSILFMLLEFAVPPIGFGTKLLILMISIFHPLMATTTAGIGIYGLVYGENRFQLVLCIGLAVASVAVSSLWCPEFRMIFGLQ